MFVSTLKEKISRFSTRRQSSILSATFVLAITFSISALLGFLRNRFLYSYFFTCCTPQLDAYNAAFRLPDLIFKLLVTGALSASFIPVFSTYLHKNPKQANQIASTIINLLLLALLVLSIIVLLFARPLSGLIAAGFSPSQLDLMAQLTQVLLIAQIFFLVSNFLTGILQVNEIFIIPAISPIVYNLFIILSIFTLAPTFGILGVTYGAVIGAFFHLAIQIPVVRKVGYTYSPIIKLKLEGVKEIIRLMIPRSLSLGLGEIQNTVTLFFTSTLPVGSLSLLNLALQLMYLPSRIFGTTIGQASLPILSKNIARNELDIFRSTVQKTILQSLFIATPITVLMLILRVPIVRLAFGAKQFPWPATLLTAKTLAYLTPAIASQAVIQILIRSFYALHNTKTPLHVSIASLIINVLSSYIFIHFSSLGIVGLAISASLGNLAQFFGLAYLFVRQVDGFRWGEVVSKTNKILLSSLFMGFATWATVQLLDFTLLDTTRTVSLLVLFALSSAVGIVSYIVVSYVLKIEECRDYERYITKIGKFFVKNKTPFSSSI